MDAAAMLPLKPEHVPDDLVFDFDYFFDPRLANDVQKGMISLIGEAPDIFWTPRNGGHWLVTRWDDVNRVMLTPTVFSSQVAPPTPAQGMTIPLTPQDMDAPDHMRYRVLLLKFLAAKEVRKYEPEARRLLGELIDAVIDKGSCEFVADIAVPMPVKVFMTMMGMDLSRYAEFVGWVNNIMAASDPVARAASFVAMTTYVGELIQMRIAHPGDDPISILLASDVNGERISVERVHEMCNLLFLAGLDTVTNAMTFITHFLAQNPGVRRRLRDDPERIPAAVEEFMRRFAFVNLPRIVASDTNMLGPQMKQGDILVCVLASASNDERNVERPEEVDLDRKKSPHVAFNTGPHNCAGAALARIELKVFLEEWLRRVPDFSLAPNCKTHLRAGPVMAMESLNLVW